MKGRNERQKRRAEKLEEFVGLLYEHRYWLDIVESRVIFKKDIQEGVSPLAKAEAICAVYFPELRDELEELDTSALKYREWMFAAAEKRAAGEQNFGADIRTVYDPYLTSFKKILARVRNHAKSEFR